MSDSEHDDEFEAYLKRRVPIDKRAGSLEHLEPPPELDRIVIGKARKAIRAASPIRFYRAPKWAVPLGIAAVILTSFAFMLDLGVRELRRQMSTQATPMAQAITSAKISPVPNTTATAVPPVATTPWPPAELPSDARRGDTAETTESDRTRTRLARAEMEAKRLRSDTDTRPVFTALTARARLASLETVPLRSVIVTGMQIDLSPALASMASSARAAIEGIPDPATRLEQIEKLRTSGRPTEAERELKQFRETYPDYPMPAAGSPGPRE